MSPCSRCRRAGGSSSRSPATRRRTRRGSTCRAGEVGRRPSTTSPDLYHFSVFETPPEEPNHVTPSAIRHLRPFPRAEEAVADPGVDAVLVALVVSPHRSIDVPEPGVDAGVVLGVHAEPRLVC